MKYLNTRNKVIDSIAKRDPNTIKEALCDFEKVLKNPKLREKEKELIEVAKAQERTLKERKHSFRVFCNLVLNELFSENLENKAQELNY